MKQSLILLLLTLMLVFTACGTDEPAPVESGETPAVSDSAIETDAPAVGDITLDSSWVIIRPEFRDVVPAKLFSKVYQALKEHCPDIKIQDDFYKDESQIAEKEILIGATNRPESGVKFVDKDEFVVQIIDGKLVIHAANVVALDAACAWFCDKIAADGVTFPADFSYVGNLKGATEKLLLVADQATAKVSVFDVSRGYVESRAKWNAYLQDGSNIAGLKYRTTDKYGDVVVIAYWNSAKMFSYPAGKVLWTADKNAAENPHSIDINPAGTIIAVASSSGSEVRFYNTDGKSLDYTAVTSRDAHGVLYDPDLPGFWLMSGTDGLAAYTAEIDADGKVKVEPIPGKSYTPPAGGLHDLQPVAGDNNKLWVAGWKTVYVFDKTTGKYSTNYDNNASINKEQVKGISQFPDGTIAFVLPDGDRQGWTSNAITCSYHLPFSGEEVFLRLPLPRNVHIYKLRAFLSDYQY